MSFQTCFSFRQRESTLQTKWALERIKCTGPETHRETVQGEHPRHTALLRQQEPSDQCFKTLLTTEPSLKEISMCICTCAQVCKHAQMLGSEHRQKGPVKEQPQGEVLNFVRFVCQASWDPSFYGSTGTTSVCNSPLYPLSHDPSSQSPIFLRK